MPKPVLVGARVTVLGHNYIKAGLALARKHASQALAAALYMEGEQIMTRSKDEFVPVKWGTLRSTGHVKEPVTQGSRMIVELGYGGPAAPYAIVQHERLDFHHTVGQAKYLEKPFMEAISGMPKRLYDRVKPYLK